METKQPITAERPILLTILCFLTFIWSGIKILSNLFNILISSITREVNLSEFRDILDEIDYQLPTVIAEDLFTTIERAITHGGAIALLSLILYMVNLLGAILMYRLKRNGFFIYIAAQILLLIVSPVFMGWNIIIACSFIFHAFFTTLFITLYAVNYKYMK